MFQAVAICTACALDRIRRLGNRPLLAGLLVWLPVTAYYGVTFLVPKAAAQHITSLLSRSGD